MNAHRIRLIQPRMLGAPAGVWVGMLLAMGCSEAGAAALGPAATSAGLMAAVAMLVLLQGWPAQVPAVALTSVGGVLLLAGAAAWLWRTRAAQRGFGASGSVLTLHTAAPRRVAALERPAALALPAGITAPALLAELRCQFVQLQAAWDVRDLPTLSALTTPQMLEEFCFDWPGGAPACGPSRTDVLTLDAALLGFEELAGTQLVSVEFSGLMRESAEQGAAPFRELWMLAKSNDDGSCWKLARHQALL
jgi:predicted lipid-binding transport protein (Tim44 family)